jgi:lipopolysaccharide biosynthesis glycosyltransferase
MWRMAIVSIYSLIKNKNLDTHYRFFILVNNKISQEIRTYFSTYIKRLDSNSEIFIETFTIKFKPLAVESVYYARLQLSELFNIDKTLYVDSDTVIMSDLQRFFNYNLGDNYIGAFPNCKHNDSFQSGFMLMNLKKIRNDKLYDKFIKYMDLPPLEQRDQSILNIECINKFDIFKDIDKTVDIMRKSNFMFHYYYALKPWNTFDDNTENNYNIWWEYCKQTPFYRFFSKHRDLDYFADDISRLDM